jgi:hypothetical protein
MSGIQRSLKDLRFVGGDGSDETDNFLKVMHNLVIIYYSTANTIKR